MRGLALGMAALLLVCTTACYNAHGIRTSELPKFNGYSTEKPVEVQEWSGRTIDFDDHSKLYLTRVSGDTVGGKFQRIAIADNRFVGKTDDGKVVNLLLPEVQQVSVDKYNRGQTIAGIIMGAIVVAGGIFLLSYVSLDQTGWCGRNVCAQKP